MTKSNGNLTGLIYFIVYAIIIVVIGAATIVFHKTAKGTSKAIRFHDCWLSTAF